MTAVASQVPEPRVPPVELLGVRFSYGREEVLRGVDLSLGPGEVCSLMGDNGAGKSTIARLAIGELRPTAGVVRLFGESPSSFGRWDLVGYLPQLPPEAVSRFPATALELVSAFQGAGARRRRSSRTQRREWSLHALERVGMAGHAARMIRELSGGQLQRVRLACALANGPRLLVLDEPTTGLDRESREELCALVAAAHSSSGLAVLLVTHDQEVIGGLGGSVLVVENGLVSRRES
ncbi:zinc transport system ATP-binding protein [Olsenella sp. KH3B4]|uniref:metal ABC transporter ATP-binding protein n=1 Tax=Olsenella sp. KH3B4 TaxID=1855394 RepID=UPI0008ACFEB0|nr:ATP-binding cassette domain-containing protein [Olsenella sp. KH3B4]SES73086.1 zinc transport system ATP-binding protein [Olsenella sp. KH3B4]